MPKLGDDQPFLLGDKHHHRTQRQRGGIGPRADQHLGDIPIAGRPHGGLIEIIFRLRQLGAQAGHLRLLAVDHAVQLALDLRLLRHRRLDQRVLGKVILPGVIDVAFRERVHPRLAPFQVALIVLV